MRNQQASTFSDKSELENLFLDCVDENRKDVLRNFTNSHAVQGGAARLLKMRSSGGDQQYKNISTKILVDQVCTSKQSRTLIFQEIFGPSEPTDNDLAQGRL